MKITCNTPTQLIAQNSFSGAYGIFFASIVLLILGSVIFTFPELSHNSKEREEVSMFLAAMGTIGLTNCKSTTWVFDKNDGYFFEKGKYFFAFKTTCKYKISEIKEIILESKEDDGIKSYGVKLVVQENKEVFTGFFDYSGTFATNLARQISTFLNISIITIDKQL